MSGPGSFLDCDSTILENNLRIIKNDYDDEFQQMFNNTENSPEEQKNFKIVKPIPALRCETPHNSSKRKTKRKGISLGIKIQILDHLAAGEGPTSVGRHFGFHESTIRTIKKNEVAIRSSLIKSPASEHSFKALKCETLYNLPETKVKKQDNSTDEIDSTKSANLFQTKAKRKGISLAMKIQILDRLAGGEGATSVGRHFGIHESTIRTIKKNEVAIRSSIIKSPAGEHSYKALKCEMLYNLSDAEVKKQDNSTDDRDSTKSPNSFEIKAKRKGISLGTKIQILDRLAAGEGSTAVGRHFGIHESTIRTIKKNEVAIRNSVLSGTKLNTKTTSYTRDIIKAKMEKALVLWIKENSRKGILLDKHSIKVTALKIYKQMKQTNRCTFSNSFKSYDFIASKTWMRSFFERNNINIKVKNENVSAIKETFNKCSFELNKVVSDGAYTSHQVWNASGTCIFWKKIPRKTYLAKLPNDFGVEEDHVTFLFCSNASGDQILKPMLLSRSLRPSTNKKLPVYWMTSEHTWVTTNIFTNWLNKYFVPEVRRYLNKKGLEFKVLLILDNETGYQNLKHPNIQFCFVPFIRTSLSQPLDQGIISSFKTYYIKQLFQYILKEVNNKNLTVTDALKKFSIIDCVKLVRLALSELKPSILNTAWKTIWPECVEHEDTIPLTITEFPKIVNLAHKIGGEGFNVISTVDIDEMLVDKPISSDEIVEAVLEDPVIDPSVIKEGLDIAEKLVNHFVVHDPNQERVKKFQSDMKFLMASYRELYKNRTKTTKKPKNEFHIKNSETSEQNNVNSDKEINISENFELVLIDSDNSSVGSDIAVSTIRNNLSESE